MVETQYPLLLKYGAASKAQTRSTRACARLASAHKKNTGFNQFFLEKWTKERKDCPCFYTSRRFKHLLIKSYKSWPLKMDFTRFALEHVMTVSPLHVTNWCLIDIVEFKDYYCHENALVPSALNVPYFRVVGDKSKEITQAYIGLHGKNNYRPKQYQNLVQSFQCSSSVGFQQ